MKTSFSLVILLCVVLNLNAQTINKTIESTVFGTEREFKIQLPRNYNPDAKRSYPLVVVLDGDYLFEPVAGNVDYQAYWEDIPDCIIIGVNQNETRNEDFLYDKETFLPADSGTSFHEFIEQELVPYVEDNYGASNYKMIVGHDLGANFINYFLLKEQPIFRAYVALSPNYTTEMVNKLQERLSTLKQETFYYLATADADVNVYKTTILEANNRFKAIKNLKLQYKFNNFKDANHYSLVGQGIPKALNKIFALYKPINSKEYKEKILVFEGSPYDYLVKKYADIEYFYGFKKPLIENDIRAIAAASNKKDAIESLEKLAELIRIEFPNSMLGAYYMGMFHEKDGDLKKALLRYKSGLTLEPSQYIDKELMLQKMYDVQDAMKND